MGLPVVEHTEESPHEMEKAAIGKHLTGVKRKIGIHSGKGGVGKTFVAVNLAFALAASEKSVGLLDADVDCPNVARFLNLRATPLRGTPDGKFHPLDYRGVKIVSTHFLTDNPDLPMIIRGPIKHKMLAELLGKVHWGELDVLLYDLPPGTADVPMSSMMIGNLDGMIVVTTPQKESIMDARKSALMAKDLDVPVLGVIENMSGDAFGTGTGERLATEIGAPFLGTIPLSGEIRKMNEKGRAALVEHERYRELAPRMLEGLMGHTVEMKRSFWKQIMRW